MPEIKETDKNLFELEKSLSSLKKYYDYDDTEYQGRRDIGNLSDEADEEYYKPMKTKSALMVITSSMKAKETKIKNYHLKKILI